MDNNKFYASSYKDAKKAHISTKEIYNKTINLPSSQSLVLK